MAKRYSIIILPNVPVIQTKVADHNKRNEELRQIQGVYKTVTIESLRRYLTGNVKYHKILTTPEGFVSKVLPAFAGQLQYLFDTYFLLFDECERIVEDVSYR